MLLHPAWNQSYLGGQKVEALVDIFNFLYPKYSFVGSAEAFSRNNLQQFHQQFAIS